MGSHPINLAIRFLLELTAICALGFWGWKQSDSWAKYILAVLISLLAIINWGVFNVPNDPSRSGRAPIRIPGMVRLSIELAIFALTVWALSDLGLTGLSILIGIIVVLHYTLSYARILWLFRN